MATAELGRPRETRRAPPPPPRVADDKQPILATIKEHWAPLLAADGEVVFHPQQAADGPPFNGALLLTREIAWHLAHNPVFGQVGTRLAAGFKILYIECELRSLDRAIRFTEPEVFVYKPAFTAPEKAPPSLIEGYLLRAVGEFLFEKLTRKEQRRFISNCPAAVRPIAPVIFGRHVMAWADLDLNRTRYLATMNGLQALGTEAQLKVRDTIAFDPFVKYFGDEPRQAPEALTPEDSAPEESSA